MKQQMSTIDILSVICFYLTIQTIDDTKEIKDKLDKILEVIENDNR